jgi:hypothetical protein
MFKPRKEGNVSYLKLAIVFASSSLLFAQGTPANKNTNQVERSYSVGNEKTVGQSRDNRANEVRTIVDDKSVGNAKTVGADQIEVRYREDGNRTVERVGNSKTVGER